MANYDLLIIGSGPAAWSCALTARQRDLSVVVAAAESATGWLQKAERIDNYPGMPAVSGKEMLRVFRQQAEEAGAQVMNSLARQIQPIGDIYMTLCGNDIIESRAVVLAGEQLGPGRQLVRHLRRYVLPRQGCSRSFRLARRH